MRRRSPARHDRRVLLLALGAGLPGGAVALLLLWTGPYLPRTQWTLTLGIIIGWAGFALAARERVVRPLQTLSNLLAALREGDFSVRARGARPDDALGLALLEVNSLSETLREQRLRAFEATALLRTVMGEIDVAVFAFDGEQRLRLVNRAGERLLLRSAERLLGHRAEELDLVACLTGEAPRTLEHAFPGGAGRWEIRRGSFRQGGVPHHLLVVADLSRALRAEERAAWQRLIRVISHEINNSLAPIQSIAGSLRDLLGRDPPPADRDEDLRQGLAVIAGRSAALGRFMSSYARLARLPPPRRECVAVGDWIRRVAGLETRLPVSVRAGPEIEIRADGDQLDPLLINLVGNATEAALETGGGVAVGWRVQGESLEVCVEDEGPGLASTGNLFVPFFTTKPRGTGIGLVLCRQIAEAHGGTLVLRNRAERTGAEAVLSLPLA